MNPTVMKPPLRQCCWLAAFITLALLIGILQPSSSQTLTGRAVDAKTGDPVKGAVVSLFKLDGERVRTTQSDSLGVYFLTAPEPASYLIRARRVGYKSFRKGPVSLPSEDTLSVHLQVEPLSVEMEELTVEAEEKQRLQEVGFYKRKRMTSGTFFEREEIKGKSPSVLSDLIGNVPGMKVMGQISRAQGGWVQSRGRRTIDSDPCVPSIMVDDNLVRQGGKIDPDKAAIQINEVISPSQVQAIEVHPRSAGVPARIGGTQSPCGAILIWTRNH